MKEFRLSHVDEGYGNKYLKVYKDGYYKDQWELLEKPMLQKILNRLKDEGCVSCLDFACGTGRISEVNAEYFDVNYGVDVSEAMLDQARKIGGQTIYIKRDLTKELLDRKFDVVTAFRFFLNAEHELKIDALNAIANSLTENGRLVTNIHVNSSSILGIAYKFRNKLSRSVKANTLSQVEFKNYLSNAGFIVEKIYLYSYLPRIGWFYPRFYASLMFPFENFQENHTVLPKGIAQCFLVVARKK